MEWQLPKAPTGWRPLRPTAPPTISAPATMQAPAAMLAPINPMAGLQMQGLQGGGMWSANSAPPTMVPPVSKDVSAQGLVFNKGKGKQGCSFESKGKGSFGNDGGNAGTEGMGGWDSGKSSFMENKGKGDGKGKGKGGKDEGKGKREDGKGKGGKDRKGKKGRDFGPFDLTATVQKLMAIGGMERDEAVKESIHVKHVLCGTEAEKFFSGLAPGAAERSLLQLALQPVLWRFPRSLRAELMEVLQKNGIELTDEHEKGKGKEGKGGKGKDRDGKGKGKGKRDRGGRYRDEGGEKGDRGFRRRGGRRDRRGGCEEEGERGRTGANTIEVNWKPPGGDGGDEEESDDDDDESEEGDEEEEHYGEDEEGGEHTTGAEGWEERHDIEEGSAYETSQAEPGHGPEEGWEGEAQVSAGSNEGDTAPIPEGDQPQAESSLIGGSFAEGSDGQGMHAHQEDAQMEEKGEQEEAAPTADGGEADEDGEHEADEDEGEQPDQEATADAEGKLGDEANPEKAAAKEPKKVKVKKEKKKKKKSLSPVRGPAGRGRGTARPAWMTEGVGAAATSKPEEPPGPAGRGRGTATPAWMQKGVGQSAIPPSIPPEVGAEGGEADGKKADDKPEAPNILDSIFEERDLKNVNLEHRSRSPRRFRGRRKGGKKGKGDDESEDEDGKGEGGKKGRDGKKGKGKGKGKKGGDQEQGGWWNRNKQGDDKEGGWWASKHSSDKQEGGWWDSNWKQDTTSQQDGGWWDSGTAQQQWPNGVPRNVGKAELKKLVQAAMNAMWNWQPGA